MLKIDNIDLFNNDATRRELKGVSARKYCDVHEIASYLNVTPRYIQLLVKRGVLPRRGKGQYDLVICIHAYLDYLKKMLSYFISKRAHYRGRFLDSYKSPHPNNYQYKTSLEKLQRKLKY